MLRGFLRPALPHAAPKTLMGRFAPGRSRSRAGDLGLGRRCGRQALDSAETAHGLIEILLSHVLSGTCLGTVWALRDHSGAQTLVGGWAHLARGFPGRELGAHLQVPRAE